MCLDMVDIPKKKYGDDYDKNTALIIDKLKEHMIDNGTRIMLEDEDIYTLKIVFKNIPETIEEQKKEEVCVSLKDKKIYTLKIRFNDDETIDDNFIKEERKNMDLSFLPDKELWAYIYGEYLLNGRIKYLSGFGLTQIETY